MYRRNLIFIHKPKDNEKREKIKEYEVQNAILYK